MSHHVWQETYGGDPTIVGAALVVEGRSFTVVGVTPPGFYGETLRGDPPDLWIPLQQEPLSNGETAILRQPVSAWLRVIGRPKIVESRYFGSLTERETADALDVSTSTVKRDWEFARTWLVSQLR